VMVLGIKHIINCGHTHCGAMHAAMHPDSVAQMPIVRSWLNHAESARRIALSYPNLSDAQRDKIMVEENVLAQLDHLRTHPSVAAALARQDMDLYGWVFDIAHGTVLSYDGEQGEFVPMSEHHMPKATPHRRRRAL
ncbi:MAG: carbonic anhydrase, partial [Acidobacteriota bacterium]